MAKKITEEMKSATKIMEWWIGKGCIQPATNLRDFAHKEIKRQVARAVKAATIKGGLCEGCHKTLTMNRPMNLKLAKINGLASTTSSGEKYEPRRKVLKVKGKRAKGGRQ